MRLQRQPCHLGLRPARLLQGVMPRLREPKLTVGSLQTGIVFPFLNRCGDWHGGEGFVEERVSTLGWYHLPYRWHDLEVGPVTGVEDGAGGVGGTGDRTEAWGREEVQSGVEGRGRGWS